jgi:hypothetical protein
LRIGRSSAYPEVPHCKTERRARSAPPDHPAGDPRMSPRIVLVPPSPDVGEIARDMAPAGFDLVLAQSGSPEYAAALGETEYMVCYPSVPLGDAFYRAAPRMRLVQLLSARCRFPTTAAPTRSRSPSTP